ncbi:hypothetical protein GGX14DRAFT_549692 [Mycena pura]|uniref:Zn(2)-C6 fungal-type domain-containing protein n=1 Tax=Mycena pura TaxID=153505 RepID=A0AAD6VSZ3_9AGAR|nr:hypothetical protein GGX14DRAFT_549692 [Mycena pura]
MHFTYSSDESNGLDEDTHIAQTRDVRNGKPSKPPGACIHCKALKVRCEYRPNDSVCQRCRKGNYECVARLRKKRKPAPTHEDLQERAHDQDRRIEQLLAEWDQMRQSSKLQQLMNIDDSKHIGYRAGDASPEVAAISYFYQNIGRKRHLSAPPIIQGCGLYPTEVIDLFSIYFERINPFFSILDPALHGDPANVIWSSPFLTTVICAMASRFYTLRPDLYLKAHSFAHDAAATALINGCSGVDVCQAYLLLAVYPIPKKKWVDDRRWLFIGVAIRMAIELGLNKPAAAPYEEREALNRTRTWLGCYCADAAHAIYLGKMEMLGLDDYVARMSREWYMSSPLDVNSPFDVHLCAQTNLLLIMGEWRKNVKQKPETGKTKGDVVSSAIQAQDRLDQEVTSWMSRFDRDHAVRGKRLPSGLFAAYLRLVILADGFQHATKKGLSRDSDILRLSINAAQTVIQIVVDRLYPTGNLRYDMDARFLHVSFAAAFLVNLLRARFLPLLKESTQQDIVRLVSKLIHVLGSHSAALDGRHSPALYSRFLSTLLAKHNVFPARGGDSPPSSDDIDVGTAVDRSDTSPGLYSWPDVSGPHARRRHTLSLSAMPSDGLSMSPPSEGGSDVYGAQRVGDLDMDLSLSHFISTVNGGQPVDAGNTVPEVWWTVPHMHTQRVYM